MAVKALTIGDTFEYVSNTDSCKKITQVLVDPNDPAKGKREHVEILPGATVFGLRPLDVFLMGYIYDNASSLSGKQGSDEVGIHTRVNQTNIDAVRFGLAYFKNFKHPTTGNDINVNTVKVTVNGREYDAADDATMQYLGVRLIAELAEEIKEKSEVSGEQEKNSEGSSTQSA